MQKIESFYKNYELLDSGDGRRLERLGEYIVDRPAPQTMLDRRLDSFVWNRANFKFDNGVWVDNNDKELESEVKWTLEVADVTFNLKLSQNGQVGIFPEQIVNWAWLENLISEHLKTSGTKFYSAENKFNIINTFAYTGGSSLFPASAAKNFPSEICHVDGSKSAVNWAGENAKTNGLTNIRWIVDDVLTFLKREVKRGKYYDGIILDPPAFGRGGKNKTWTFNKDLGDLLTASKELLSPAGPLFFMISCHDINMTTAELREVTSNTLNIPDRFIETLELNIPSNRGNPLSCGVCARFKKS
ncbi:MAG: class I SAM-dependent methyltransferase [bacterium]